MSRAKGRYLRISMARRLVADVMHFSLGRPLIPIEREMNLSEVVAARSQLSNRPGWCAIFVKAYAILSQRKPELRQALIPYPTARFYQHDTCVAAVAIERELEGEAAVFAAMLKNPEKRTLREVEAWLRECKEAPLKTIPSFRRALRYFRWPRLLRRMLFSMVLNWWGSKRAEYFGTFGISVTAGMGAATLALLSPLTTTIHYGRFDEAGNLPLRITFDHHVLDAAVVARAMVELEGILKNEILTELREMNPSSTSLPFRDSTSLAS